MVSVCDHSDAYMFANLVQIVAIIWYSLCTRYDVMYGTHTPTSFLSVERSELDRNYAVNNKSLDLQTSNENDNFRRLYKY